MNLNELFAGSVSTVAPHPKKKVMIVEDDLFWQEMLKNAVKLAIKTPIEFYLTRNIGDAREFLKSGFPLDVLVADHFVDGPLTGFEFWMDCKRHFIHIPFLLTSGISKTQIIREMNDELKCDFHDESGPTFVEKSRSLLEISKQIELALFKETLK